MKRCTKCGELKPLSEFHRDQYKKDGLRSQCKTCGAEYYKANREKRVEYNRKYREVNPEKVAEYQRKWHKANPEYNRRWRKVNREKIAEYNEANREKIIERKREYNEAHREEIAENRREYQRKRRDEDIQYKLARNLRTRLYCALKGNFKNGSAVRDLGCSIDELKAYLESRFAEGMTWDNYGEWHVDHILPLSSFDLTDRKQLLQACHYTNLQPLWAEDNLRKNNKTPEDA